jgi:hypothetical protein
MSWSCSYRERTQHVLTAIISVGPLHTYINFLTIWTSGRDNPAPACSPHLTSTSLPPPSTSLPPPSSPQLRPAMTTIVSGMPIVSSTQVVVDDRNPLISYGGPWGLGGVASEYNSTTHGVTSPATVHLSFQGVWLFTVSVVAVIHLTAASRHIHCSLRDPRGQRRWLPGDLYARRRGHEHRRATRHKPSCGQQHVWSAVFRGEPSAVRTGSHRLIACQIQSPQLPAAIHTLNITIGPCNSNNTAIYWLDYFVFQPIAKSTS